MKKAIKLALVLFMALLVPVTNYMVDPASLFTADISGSVEEQAANILLSGQNAMGLVNYDERLLKRLCIYGLSDIEVLALGSSRVALIDSEMAGSDSFFNLAVTGAAMRDVVAMYGVAHMNGLVPKRVILALDPWFVNSSYSSRRFERVLTDGYAYCLTQLMGYDSADVGYDSAVSGKYLADENPTPLWDLPPDTLGELFSFSYFQDSLKRLLESGLFRHTVVPAIPAKERFALESVLRCDGSYAYPAEYRGNTPQEITELAESQIVEGHSHITGCEDARADDPYRGILYDFVKSLVASGVQVDLVMPPLNPILWDYMLQHPRYAPIVDSIGFYRDMADALGCRLVGSFDPHELGAAVEDFYDGYHYRPERLAELLTQLEVS